MKKFIVLISALCLISCVKNNLGEGTEKTIEVTFSNGDKDTLSITTVKIFLREGDLEAYKSSDPFNYETVASGVRSFKILKE